VTSLQSVGAGQVNAFFQAAGNAGGGAHNVIIFGSNGSNAITSSDQVFVITVTLKTFSFTNSVPYSRDCSGSASPITQPTWPAPTSGVACPEIGFAGDHAVYPSAPGTMMSGTANFSVNPAPPQAVSNIYVQGITGSNGTFTATSAVSLPANQTTFSAPVVTNTAFPASETQFINSLSINWSVAESGPSCNNSTCTSVAVGTSSNPLYVTLAPNVFPATAADPVMLTYVALAVGSGGATTPTAALANTWAQFSSGSAPANVVTWDGERHMYYYTVGFQSCVTNASSIVQTNGTIVSATAGQCGAFAALLESALAMNGIHSTWTQVQASDGVSKMVIKTWGLSGSPTYQNVTPSVAPWVYKLTLNAGDYMVPTPSAGFGDLIDGMGIPGQGEGTPEEKVFDLHFIVQVPIASGNQYYDPSYGVTYPSAVGFESQSVQGYAKQMGSDFGGQYHFRVAISPPLNVNITFTPVPANSM
jgi:hypothetical protein